MVARGPAHRPHPRRAVRGGTRLRRHRRRAAPAERVRRAPADARRAGSSSTPASPGSRACRSRRQPVKLARTPSSIRRSPRQVDDDADVRRRSRGAPVAPRRRDATCCSTACASSSSASPRSCPRLCAVLSELGADVIKIESMANPDVLRMGSGERRADQQELHLQRRVPRSAQRRARPHHRTGSRARARAVRVGRRRRREPARRRARPTRPRLRDVRALNPRVIYASSQGYGRGGPFGEMPAYGPLNSGFSGVHVLWNHPDAPYPCGTSMNHPDHIAGRLLAVGVLAALREREASGEGQLLELAQTEAAAYLIGEVYLEGGALGRRSRTARQHPPDRLTARRVPVGRRRPVGRDRGDGRRRVGARCARPSVGTPTRPLRPRPARVAAARGPRHAPLAAWTSPRTKEAAASSSRRTACPRCR